MQKEYLIKSLRKKGFSKNIVDAFEKIDRKKFLPECEKASAYEDTPLPIGYEQTISQPYTIAFMLSHLELKNKQKILEVGSGSGYVLELINHISKDSKIFGIERIKELVESSRGKLNPYKNIKIIHGNGSKGLEDEAPFDRILVSACSEEIPEKLVNQLKLKGILVASVKNSIIVLKRKNLENKIKEYPGFRFVPLIED